MITPRHKRKSTAEGLRVYASNDCPGCDPVSYILEGRVDEESDWVLVHQGDLPWKSDITFPRNRVPGLDISSTYMSADKSFLYTEVSFYEHDYQTCGTPSLQNDYRGFISNTKNNRTCQAWSSQFPHGHSYFEYYYPNAGVGGDNNNYCRNPNNQPGGAWCYTTDPSVRWEYCDVPDCVDDPATLGEYSEYRVTWTATRDPESFTLQIGELEIPGMLSEKPVMPVLQHAGVYVSSITRNSCVCNEQGITQAEISGTPCSCISIIDKDTCDVSSECDWNPHSTHISLIGGHSNGVATDQNALDHKTDKFVMELESLDVVPGTILTPLVCCPTLSTPTNTASFSSSFPCLPSRRPAVHAIARKDVCADRPTYLHRQQQS